MMPPLASPLNAQNHTINDREVKMLDNDGGDMGNGLIRQNINDQDPSEAVAIPPAKKKKRVL